MTAFTRALLFSCSKSLAAGLMAGALGLLPLRAAAQVLVVTPGCGTPGSSARITGSGWAEPSPVCDYLFRFDGAEVAPRQPDGLFGPPNRTFTVPAGATPGDHTVKVELQLRSGQLLQCRQRKFKVVSSILDPWAGGSNITVSGGGINVKFDPKDVCDVTPCSKIVMIQTVTNIGQKADGSQRFLTYAEQGFPSAATRDADVISGRTIDYIPGEADPYYNGDDPADSGLKGVQNGSPAPSTLPDAPNLSDSKYPADIVKIIWDFEVGVFCAQGHDKGQFVGSMRWHWERPKGGTRSVTVQGSARSAPSADFMAVLNRWNTNHGFTLPTAGAATTGGDPCN